MMTHNRKINNNIYSNKIILKISHFHCTYNIIIISILDVIYLNVII